MNHTRIAHTVLSITAVYVVILVIWITHIAPDTPEETVGWQMGGLLAMYAVALGAGMMWAQHPSRRDRHILNEGLEGWATIAVVRPAQRKRHFGSTPMELTLDITIPGMEPYSGTLVTEVAEGEENLYAPGETIPVRIDPDNRDRIILRPQ
ncbi:hypothetical protein ONR57_04425 [Hoyosella sp. YIM 151337]|uniref:hypothetical protein n=1 Tax=Hoyosella sp. YIM 151337 TaxID=2992742 RepID=UPI0022355E3C|nr:hypothetical protein [Hoyosella sp. YIM 151337]MCW4352547.1 hypothetical protein [Hoyosella sp. YIM 151337]